MATRLLSSLFSLFILFGGCCGKGPPISCHFSPADGVRHHVGTMGFFNLTCVNNMHNENRNFSIIQLFHDKGDALKLCVEHIKNSSWCDVTDKDIFLNMTSYKYTFRFQVATSHFGIRCLNLRTLYQEGNILFNSGIFKLATEANLTNMEYADLKNLEEESDTFSEIYFAVDKKNKNYLDYFKLIKEDNKFHDHSNDEEKDFQLADMNGKTLTWTNYGMDRQYDVFTSDEVSSGEETMGDLAAWLVMIGLCLGNFFIGTAILAADIWTLGQKCMSGVRQCNCFLYIFQLQAWKVGLFCQLFFLPIISFFIGILLFRNVSCTVVVELSRLGLFLMGTAPGNSSSLYYTVLFKGNLNLAVSLLLLSTTLNPITSHFWWNTLGNLLQNDDSKSLEVPLEVIFKNMAMLTIPILFGTIISWKIPGFKKIMDKFRIPFFLIGGIVTIFIFYFTYKNFFEVCTPQHLLGGAALSIGGGLIAIGISFYCGFSQGDMAAIYIATSIQNGGIIWSIIRNMLNNPERQYASNIADSQILFTGLPMIVIWIIYCIYNYVKAFLEKRKKSKTSYCGTDGHTVIPSLHYDQGINVVVISSIKEAWTNQDLTPLWI